MPMDLMPWPYRSFLSATHMLHMQPYEPLTLPNELEIMEHVRAMHLASLAPHRQYDRIGPVRPITQPVFVPTGRALLLIERLYGEIPNELRRKLANSFSIRIGLPMSHADWLVVMEFVSSRKPDTMQVGIIEEIDRVD